MRFWKIEGYDGLSKIYEKELALDCFAESTIQTKLQCDGSRARVIDMCRLAVFDADTSIAEEVEVLL